MSLIITKRKRVDDLLTILNILFYLLFAIYRLYPFHNTISSLLIGTDDWNRYINMQLT